MLENGNSPPADPPRAEQRVHESHTPDDIVAVTTVARPGPPPPSGTPLSVRVCRSCSTETVTYGSFCPHCGTPYESERPRHRLTRRGKIVLWALSAALVLGGVAAGVALKAHHDGSERDHSGAPDTPDESTPVRASRAQPVQPKPKLAGVGDPVTFETSDTTLEMTVLAVVDPLAAGEYDEPAAGKRFIGVRVAVRNVGGESYSDALSNGALMVDSNDEQADSTIVSGGECSSDFSSDIRLSPGSREVGCIPFEINDQARPKTFQFAGDSGFGPDNAEWRLTGAVATADASPATTSTGGTTAAPSGARACDPNISAGTGTTCPFAENVFKAYWRQYSANGEQSTVTVEATSPATGRSYTMQCDLTGGTVNCTGGDNAFVTFPLHAVEVY